MHHYGKICLVAKLFISRNEQGMQHNDVFQKHNHDKIWFRIKIGDFDSCNQVGSNHLFNCYIVQMSKTIMQQF
jgi:hypothetical protein